LSVRRGHPLYGRAEGRAGRDARCGRSCLSRGEGLCGRLRRADRADGRRQLHRPHGVVRRGARGRCRVSDVDIEVKDLTRRFGDFTAVDRISFDVRAGEVFGFLGANGAGKTTAIRMRMGLREPSGGSARIAGHDIYTESEAIKQSIGYMSQRFSLYEDLT